ncbi:MAG: hypothetical protein J6S25_00330 [Aeriscardovia sp.]|nr:hypothetical protein [Aeriscardovia sp.]
MADDKNQGTEPQAQEPKVEWVAVLVLGIIAVAVLIVGFSVYMARKINEYQDQQKMAEKQAEQKQAAAAAKIFTKVIDMKATANGPAVATVDMDGTQTSYTFTNNWTKTEDVKVSQDLEKYDASQDAVVVSVKTQSSSNSSKNSSSKVSVEASESGKTIAQSSGTDHATLSVTVGDVAK